MFSNHDNIKFVDIKQFISTPGKYWAIFNFLVDDMFLNSWFLLPFSLTNISLNFTYLSIVLSVTSVKNHFATSHLLFFGLIITGQIKIKLLWQQHRNKHNLITVSLFNTHFYSNNTRCISISVINVKTKINKNIWHIIKYFNINNSPCSYIKHNESKHIFYINIYI